MLKLLHMPTYRLDSPLVGIPIGTIEPITIPTGTVVEKDDFLKTVGLTEVLLNGRRVTLLAHDFIEAARRVPPPVE